MNPEFVDLLRTFVAHDVRFLVVGAYALALHGRPRATGDLAVWIDATPENAARVVQALRAFGAPTRDIAETDFATPGVVVQLGVAPGRIDIVTELTGLTFADAWPDRVCRPFGDVAVDFIGRVAFIRNTRNGTSAGSRRHRGTGLAESPRSRAATSTCSIRRCHRQARSRAASSLQPQERACVARRVLQ